MVFRILESRHKDAGYHFVVQGPESWHLSDLVPYMNRVAMRSKDYSFMGGTLTMPEIILTHRKGKRRVAKLTLEDTLIPKIKRIRVVDYGIGGQMINKFVRSIEGKL